MKIIDNRKSDVTAFAKVPVGTTFFFKDESEMGGGLYMRIPGLIDEDGDTLNAIDLEEGYLVTAQVDDPVIRCCAEIVIS